MENRGFFLVVDPTYLVYSVGKLMLLKLRQDFTIREADAYYRMYCFSPEYIEKMNDALRQAGLPE